MRRPNFNLKHALIIAGIAVLAMLVVDFNSRVADLRRQSAQREQVAAELESYTKTAVYLETQVAYATSDEAVVEWAYDEGNMIRPGDHPVVPIPPADSTPAPQPTQKPATEKVSNLEVWLWLFFEPAGSSVRLGSP